MVAERLLTFRQGDNRHTISRPANLQVYTVAAAAKKLQVSPRTVAAASRVRRKGVPGLARMVDAGEVSVHTAAEVASLPVSKQKEIVREGPESVQAAASGRRNGRRPAPGRVPSSRPIPLSISSGDRARRLYDIMSKSLDALGTPNPEEVRTLRRIRDLIDRELSAAGTELA
jgi:hypothetical protein